MLLCCAFSLHFLKMTLAIFSYTYPSFVHYFCDKSVEIFRPFDSGLLVCVWLSNKRFCFCGPTTSLSLILDAFCIGFPLVSSFFILKQWHYIKEKVLGIFNEVRGLPPRVSDGMHLYQVQWVSSPLQTDALWDPPEPPGLSAHSLSLLKFVCSSCCHLPPEHHLVFSTQGIPGFS